MPQALFRPEMAECGRRRFRNYCTIVRNEFSASHLKEWLCVKVGLQRQVSYSLCLVSARQLVGSPSAIRLMLRTASSTSRFLTRASVKSLRWIPFLAGIWQSATET